MWQGKHSKQSEKENVNMGKYAKYNAQNVLDNVNKCIAELENIDEKCWNFKRFDRISTRKVSIYEWKSVFAYKMSAVCEELSIFDWWKDTLSLSQLKQMKKFLETAIKLGYTGYVCFKVGASGCAHGMWASQKESENGHSPDDDEVLFHSFRSGDNYWGVCHKGIWDEYSNKRTLEDVKKIINDKSDIRWVVR